MKHFSQTKFPSSAVITKFHKFGLMAISSLALVAFNVSSMAISALAQETRSFSVEAGANTEFQQSDDKVGKLGYSISVDGERIDGDQQPVDLMRKTDSDLSKLDIQVKFDGLDVSPVLNVATKDLRHSYNSGDEIQFNASFNYPEWITKSEVRIVRKNKGFGSELVSVLDVDAKGNAHWKMPNTGDGEFEYFLRVYDAQGRFDETLPLALSRTSKQFKTHQVTSSRVISAGDGDDRTRIRNIPVYGGAVTIYGRNLPSGYHISALGESVPVDQNASFVMQRILPTGDHSVDVTISKNNDEGVSFVRELHIPSSEWFYVGLADITLGKHTGSDQVVPAAPGEYDRYYGKGRLAFYLKGKIKGQYILTAAADTGEENLDKILHGLDEKDPRQLLKRIDPDDYYPVYGDDSTSVEDAPTSGKFYVRLERGDSHVMWGNYKTTITGSEFARNERALYGAHALMRSEQTAAYGERVIEAEAYASQPGTLPARDTLRGTGGSVYFLSRQDITRGSETLTVEVRDPVSGVVISRNILRVEEDYDIDYIQGVVILKQPLNSTASSGTVVSDGALGSNIVNLVAQYEYTPALGEVEGYSYGGRAQSWINDHVRLGVTGMNEQTGIADHKIIASDIHVKLAENSFVEAEISKSKGPGFSSTNSVNGGLTINSNGTSGIANKSALAYRLRAEIDISDFDLSQKGRIGAYYENREKGFSSPGYETLVDQRVWGAFADVEVNEDLRYRLGYEDFRDAAGKSKREGEGELEFTIAPNTSLALGIKHTALENPAIAIQNGQRTDLGARLTYEFDEDQKLYVFGQKTVHREGAIERNDRYGFGAEARVSEKITINGEISHGTSGWGGFAGLNYEPTADDHYYIGYRLDPDRGKNASTILNGTDLGGIVVGSKRRYSDALSAYIENNYDMYGRRRSLTTTYGVVYTPDALWTLNGGLEYGDVEDPNSDDITRTAISASVGYNNEDVVSWRVRGEARFDDSTDAAKNRDTYLLSAGASIKSNEDWRFLSNLDVAISNSNQSSILDGDYIEASIGYAYRPVDNDRVNALLKYTFLYDLPGPDQVTVDGSVLGAAQRSHIFSADVNFDLNQYLTIGAKYGFRIGEVSSTRASDDFVKSSAHLGVLRADWHVVKNWDILFEGRVLKTPEIETKQYGLLAAIYRHLGSNLKVGIGYNFGSFSDDVSDLTYDDGGVFFNIVGKF